MPAAQKVNTNCPQCGDTEDVWMFDKEEGTGTKECYTCDSCGSEWSKMQ